MCRDAVEDAAHLQRIADRSAREAVIRDLYALVAFYVANPDHPLPHYLQIGHFVQREEDVKRLADNLRRPVYRSGVQFDHMISGTSVPISMMVAVRPFEFEQPGARVCSCDDDECGGECAGSRPL